MRRRQHVGCSRQRPFGSSPSRLATAAATTLVDAAESGDRATALRLLGEKGANPNASGAGWDDGHYVGCT